MFSSEDHLWDELFPPNPSLVEEAGVLEATSAALPVDGPQRQQITVTASPRLHLQGTLGDEKLA